MLQDHATGRDCGNPSFTRSDATRVSTQTEARILGEIARITRLELVTLRVECKTSLCKLYVAQRELTGGTRLPDLVGRWGMRMQWVVAVVDRNGVPTSLAYLERPSAEPGAPPQ